MLELSLPLHRKMYPYRKPELGSRSKPEYDPATETLDRIAQRHSTPETYVADAKADLDEARQFVQDKKYCLKLPPRDDSAAGDPETPTAFMRGISLGGRLQCRARARARSSAHSTGSRRSRRAGRARRVRFKACGSTTFAISKLPGDP